MLKPTLAVLGLTTLLYNPLANAGENPLQQSSAKDISAKNITAVTEIKNDDSESKDKIKTYHVYDDIDMISKINIIYEKPRIVIKTVTPVLSSDAGDVSNVQFFNDAVSEVVSQEIDAYKARVQANSNAFKGMKKYSNKLNIDFDSSAIDSGESHTLSIRFNVQGFIAGTQKPYHYHRSFNYDLDNNKVLTLNDLFESNKDYLTVISYLSNQYLSRRLSDKYRVNQGTSPMPQNFKNWNIKPYGLYFTFDESQVAPPVYGAQSVLIPYPALSGLIPSDSPIAGCLKHHKRCIRDNLLTGGFIDEV